MIRTAVSPSLNRRDLPCAALFLTHVARSSSCLQVNRRLNATCALLVQSQTAGVDGNGSDDDDQYGSEDSDEDAAEVAKPEKRAFGAVDELQQREYEQWAHRKAKRLNKQRKWDEAIEVAKDGLDIDPNSKFLDDDLTHAYLSKGNEELAAANYGRAAIVFRSALAFCVDTPTGPVGLRDTDRKNSKLKAALAEANKGERNLRIPIYQDKPCAGCFCGFVGFTVLLAVIGAVSPAPESICATTQPCLNGAECTDNLLDGTHACTCAPGWSGEDCSTLGNGDPATLPPSSAPAEAQPPPLTDAETQALVGVLLISGGAAAVWGGLWLRVVRTYPRKLVKITFGALVCAQCSLGALLLGGFGSPNGESNGFGVVFFLSAAFVLLLGFVLSRQNLVPFAVALFCSATDVMRQHSSMIGVVYATAVITMGWLFICCLALTVTGVTSYGSLVVYFTYFWFAHTSKAVVHCTVAGTTANWYFVTHQIDPVLQAASRATKTSLGSLAFGSLLTASLQMVRVVRAIILARRPGLSHMSQANAGSGTIGQFLETFNDYAYVQIAVYGRPYMDAAKTTAQLLRNAGVVAIIGNTVVVSGVCVLGCVLAGAVAAALAWWLLLRNDLEQPLGGPDGVQAFSFLCFCLGYLMALPHMEVLRAVTTTVLVCFAQNPHVLHANNPHLYNEIEGVFSDIAHASSHNDTGDQVGDDYGSASGDDEDYEYEDTEERAAARKMVRFKP